MAMMQIKTTRFGDVELDENRLIRFPEGMIGFPDMKSYVLLEHKPGSPFMWLQSTESPDLAFVLVDPHLVQADYLQRIPPRERAHLAGENGRDPLLFAVVTIPPGEPSEMTANLLGPVVIDVPARTGRQVILADSGFSTRHAVVRD